GPGTDHPRDAAQARRGPLRRRLMNRTRRDSLAMIAALLLSWSVSPPAAAQTQTGGVPGAWLDDYTGARSLGMGGALAGVGDEALGALWNPAGLQFMDQNQLMFENVRLFEDAS